MGAIAKDSVLLASEENKESETCRTTIEEDIASDDEVLIMSQELIMQNRKAYEALTNEGRNIYNEDLPEKIVY